MVRSTCADCGATLSVKDGTIRKVDDGLERVCNEHTDDGHYEDRT